ncbi:MAG: ABC transporter ATP-binding protein, partial [Lachnospiraceae bacterium]|nr:ABC transporter ATP-binding protein [Lachnospiraceae bacterium]
SNLKTYLFAKFQYQLDYDLLNRVMNTCAGMSLQEFEDSRVQDQVQHIESQIGFRPYSIFTMTFNLISSVTTVLSAIVILVMWKPWSVLLIVLPAMLFSVFYLSISKREFQTEERNAKKSRNLWYLEFLLTKDQSFKEVKIFRLADYIIRRHNEIKQSIIKESLYNSKVRLAITQIFDLVDQICMAVLMILIIFSVIGGEILIGTAVSLLRVISMLFDGFNSIMSIFYGINQNSLYMSKLIAFLEEKRRTAVGTGEKKIDDVQSIEIRHLNFCYPGTEKEVLKDIQLKVSKGERIALFGRNGSGKSTLIKLLMGYYSVGEEMIKVNGIPLADVQIESLHRMTGILFQDYCKYELPLRDNVGFGNVEEMENEDRIREALEKAGVDFMPPDLNIQLGKWFADGVQLSGGQWQRIAIARCFFKNAQLYILDEPNAALDKMGEKKIMKTFFDLTKDRIGIFISHKIAHAMQADRIVYLDDGKIIAQGTHEELMRSCPQYKAIYDMEFNVEGEKTA